MMIKTMAVANSNATILLLSFVFMCL